MSGKKWAILVLAALLCVFLVWAGLNILVDPFNAFGDMLMQWDSYTQTLNPRNSKAVYVSEHFDEFDSYIVGSSSAASYLPETLNRYLDASFYNMFHYGADTGYDKELIRYLLEHDDVKYIFLVLGLSESDFSGSTDISPKDYLYYEVSGESRLSYYWKHLFASPNYAIEKISSYLSDTELPQVFDVFIPESGTYDKRVREIESIGTLSSYMDKNSSDFPFGTGDNTLQTIDICTEDVRQIREMCDNAGAELIVVLTPMSSSQLSYYTDDTLNQYFEELSSVTDYWNFAISPLTYDERYFYDSTHTRNETANMVMARIFEDTQTYYPDHFGTYCVYGSSVLTESLKSDFAHVSDCAYTETVPILLYHHLAETAADNTLHPETFRKQIELLYNNGYNPVNFDDLIAFVEYGTPLPEKPVIITFDDGYISNYEFAFPVLQEYGFQATIFVIGCSVGHERYYKDTEYELIPHFGQEQIDEMLASGLISIESHTYDMHQWAPFETGTTIRENIVPLEGENEKSYIEALRNDVFQQEMLFEELGVPRSQVLAFPGGAYSTITDVVLKSCGYKVTVTTDLNRINTIVAGLPQSLIDLGRMNIDSTTTDEQILEYLNRE